MKRVSIFLTRAGNKYLYNGKEYIDDLDLNVYSYGARDYDPVLCRFHVIDRFAEKYMPMSTYQYAANNPALLIDINGDSIPTTFYNQYGQQTNTIPAVLQNLFQQEYGITLGYENGMLFKAGDYETDLEVSEDAKAEWENLLGAENSKQSLMFGYDMALDVDPSSGKLKSPVRMGKYSPLQKTAFIDLADFDASGSKIAGSFALSIKPFGFNMRSKNLARTIEHEFIGHGVKGITDESKNVNLINTYRTQMGLFVRDSYQHVYERRLRPDLLRGLPAKHHVGQSYGKHSTILVYEKLRLEKMSSLFSNF